MSVNILGVDYNINDTVRLDLSAENLIEIPEGVFELINLKELGLDYNELIEIPLNINKLVKLTTLRLGNNKLTTIPDIRSLVKLNYLDLNHNELTSIPCELCEMKKLRYVNLGNNCIHDEESIKIFNDLPVRSKHMSDQKQLIMSSIILPMVII